MRMTFEQRINQEAEMYRLGYQAALDVIGIENWPRIGKPRSNEQHRCRAAWQHGYRCCQLEGAGEKINPILPVLNAPPYNPDASDRDQLAIRLANLIVRSAPINMRSLLRKFSSTRKPLLLDIITEWYEKGLLNLEYKGKRTSPTRILGFTQIPTIESFKSAQQGNTPASPPLEPELLPDYQKFSETALGRQIDEDLAQDMIGSASELHPDKKGFTPASPSPDQNRPTTS